MHKRPAPPSLILSNNRQNSIATVLFFKFYSTQKAVSVSLDSWALGLNLIFKKALSALSTSCHTSIHVKHFQAYGGANNTIHFYKDYARLSKTTSAQIFYLGIEAIPDKAYSLKQFAQSFEIRVNESIWTMD